MSGLHLNMTDSYRLILHVLTLNDTAKDTQR